MTAKQRHQAKEKQIKKINKAVISKFGSSTAIAILDQAPRMISKRRHNFKINLLHQQLVDQPSKVEKDQREERPKCQFHAANPVLKIGG